MAGKRISLVAAANQPVESIPGISRPTLVHLSPDLVVPTPLNPRRDFAPSGLEELGNSMREGQLQPCVAIARAKYVKLFPEHADQVPDSCQVVMAAGERRWRAAQKVGLPTLDVHIRQDIGESRVKFLAAVLTENVERSNFNYIEEARGLNQMLEMAGGNQTQAAQQLNKSKQWFSQRIGLLRLSEEMQALVIAGKLTALRDLRRYSALPADEQVSAWKADLAAAERAKQAPPVSVTPAPPELAPPAPAPAAEVYTAVYTPPSVEVQPEPDAISPPLIGLEPGESGSFTAVKPVGEPQALNGAEAERPVARPAPDVPDPRASQEQTPAGDVWEDGEVHADEVIARMPQKEIHRLTMRLLKHNSEVQSKQDAAS